jgi:hypothetical protein
MAAQISVHASKKGQGWDCHVTVSEPGSRTLHTVHVKETYRDRLVGASVPVERLVEKSFEFLLAREPKESILRSFDLPVIAHYFPEYEQKIGGEFNSRHAL